MLRNAVGGCQLSRVRVSVWPSIFLYAKNTQNLGETGPPLSVFISMTSNCHQRNGSSRLAATDPSNSDGGVCGGGVCVHTFAPEPGRSTLNVLNYKYKYFPPRKYLSTSTVLLGEMYY